jgi:hypothetical protein
MSSALTKFFRAATCYAAVLALAGASFIFAQDQQNAGPQGQTNQEQASPGWHRFSGPPPAPPADPQNRTGSQTSASNPYQPYGPANSQQGPSVPPRLVIQRGAYMTVRTNQMLSSNQNLPGDAFTTTLEKPVVVDGLVVAQRGETVGGRVVEAKKAGRIKGVSHLTIELTSLTTVDGQQVPIQSQLISQEGPTSRARDAGAVTTTTGLGAAVGAAANGGAGAAVGAGAGAIAGVIGVLATRGHPTVIYPESLLTFQLEAPVTVSTTQAPQAFHYVELDAYARNSQAQNSPPAPPSLCNGRGCAPPPPPPDYYGPAYYPPFFTYFGPAFYPFGFGPTFFLGVR